MNCHKCKSDNTIFFLDAQNNGCYICKSCQYVGVE
jgi:hypothetical protein